jgi:hypothetical protein
MNWKAAAKAIAASGAVLVAWLSALSAIAAVGFVAIQRYGIEGLMVFFLVAAWVLGSIAAYPGFAKKGERP